MATRIQVGDPECAWPPFLEWLAAQGVDANDVTAIDVDTDAMTATLYPPAYPPTEGPQRVITITSPPPLHPSRETTP